MGQDVVITIKTLDKTSQGMRGAVDSIKSLHTAVLGVTGTLAGMAAAAKFAIDAAKEQTSAELQVAEAIRSTGGAAGFTLEELKAMAGGFQDITNVGDEATLAMQSVLLTFKEIEGANFERATAAIIDLSERMGQDLQSSAVQVGKALNDPIVGVSALQRVGVSFSATQKEVIKDLAETGRVAEAQVIILEALEEQFGGSAAAAVEADGGYTQLMNKVGDLAEVVGQDLTPAWEKAVAAMSDATDAAITLWTWHRKLDAIIDTHEQTVFYAADSYEDYVDEMVRAAVEAGKLREDYADMTAEFAKGELQANFLATALAKDLAGGLNLATRETFALRQEMEAAGEQNDATRERILAHAEATEEHNQKMEEQRQEMEEAAEAAREYAEALREVFTQDYGDKIQFAGLFDDSDLGGIREIVAGNITDIIGEMDALGNAEGVQRWIEALAGSRPPWPMHSYRALP